MKIHAYTYCEFADNYLTSPSHPFAGQSGMHTNCSARIPGYNLKNTTDLLCSPYICRSAGKRLFFCAQFQDLTRVFTESCPNYGGLVSYSIKMRNIIAPLFWFYYLSLPLQMLLFSFGAFGGTNKCTTYIAFFFLRLSSNALQMLLIFSRFALSSLPFIVYHHAILIITNAW